MSLDSNTEARTPLSIDFDLNLLEEDEHPRESEEKSKEMVSKVANQENQEAGDNPKSSKPRLTGAAIKRYKWLKRNGYSEEEALLKCKDPMGTHSSKLDGDKSNKRARSNDTTPEDERKRKKLSTSLPLEGREEDQGTVQSHPPISYKGITSGIRVGVCAAGYPEESLNEEQFKALEACILEAVCSDQSVIQRFHGTSWRSGWLQFMCLDEVTAGWLRDIVPTIVPWEGAKLRVMKEDEFPRRKPVVVYLPKSEEEDSKIIKFLDSQNPKEFKINTWRVYKRDDSSPRFTQLTFGVDEKIAALLINVPTLSYKYGQANCRVAGLKRETQAGTSGEAGTKKGEDRGKGKPEGQRTTVKNPEKNAPSPVSRWGDRRDKRRPRGSGRRNPLDPSRK